jgi:hypothetical protein
MTRVLVENSVVENSSRVRIVLISENAEIVENKQQINKKHKKWIFRLINKPKSLNVKKRNNL